MTGAPPYLGDTFQDSRGSLKPGQYRTAHTLIFSRAYRPGTKFSM